MKIMDNKEKPIIQVKELTKIYGTQKAVDSLTLEIYQGEAFGFIGPNGAGKTTTIRILSTLLEPDGGDAFIKGASIIDEPEEVKKYIGYMPDYFGVYDGLTVTEYLEFFAKAYQRNPKNIISDVLELTDLTVKADSPVETLSRGMRQRLGIARILLHDPDILILDEPAAGLDPRARIELKELLKELVKLGKTIFISSHILPELSDLCTSIGIIEAGKLLAYGDVSTFMDMVNQDGAITIQIKTLKSEDIETLTKTLKNYKGVLDVRQVQNREVMVNFSGDEKDASLLLSHIVHAGINILEFSEKKSNLEDIFMKITKGEVV